MTAALRHAVFRMRQRPVVSLVAILSLGLAIGAGTLVFALFDAIIQRPPRGVSEPARVLDLGRRSDGREFRALSYAELRDVAAQARTLSAVYGYALRPLNLTRDDGPVRALGFVVTEDYFAALGVGAALGRVFRGPESAPGMRPEVVLGHGAWQRWFGGDPRVVGRRVRINGHEFAVVGVLGPGFRGHVALLDPDFFVPVSMVGVVQTRGHSLLEDPATNWLLGGARMADGATLAAVRDELAAIAMRRTETRPEAAGHDFSVAPITGMPRATVAEARPFVGILFALIAVVLAVACVNVAGVLLVQGEDRLRETGIRYALGARRTQIVRQALLEHGLLALAAGAVGFGIAAVAGSLVRALPLNLPIPFVIELAPDWRVAGFGILVSALAAMGFGLLPALRASRVDPRQAIATGGLRSDRASGRLRETLVIAQVALSLVLLVAAGLLGRALQRAEGIDPGFRADGVLSAELDFEPGGLDAEAAARLADAVRARIDADPAVDAAAVAGVVPLSLSTFGLGGAWRAGDGDDPSVFPSVNVVSEGYFEALRVPLRGRDFRASDDADAPRVAVINALLAEQLFGTTDVLEREFDYEGFGERTRVRVIGIVPTGKYASLGERPEPFIYLSLRQRGRESLNLLARTDLPEDEFRRRVAAVLGELAPDQPPPAVSRLTELAQLGLLPQRVAGGLAAAMGILGLVLAAIGLHGVIAYGVTRRTREIGVRLALGAHAARITRAVLLGALRLAGIGIAIGLAISLLAGQALAGLLLGGGVIDGVVLGGAIALLSAVAGLSAWFPARRAGAVQPMQALRHD